MLERGTGWRRASPRNRVRYMTDALKLAAALALLSAPAFAEATDACAAHKFRVAPLLDSAKNPAPWQAGDTVELGFGAQAYSLTLAPSESLAFAPAPERAPKSDTFGAIVSVAPTWRVHHVQIALSDRAWIDVVQNGKAVPSESHSGADGCLLHK